MGNAKIFFEEVAKTEEAKQLFATIEKPETEKELIAAYVDIAKKLGIDLTAEEVNEYLVSDKIDGLEIDDEELSQLVGGRDADAGNDMCNSSFKNEENCWTNDGCDVVYRDYGNHYVCKIAEISWETYDSIHRPVTNVITISSKKPKNDHVTENFSPYR
jgi:hypothetical protein